MRSQFLKFDRWASMDDHMVNHYFMDWLGNQTGAEYHPGDPKDRSGLTWEGVNSGKETWVDFETYARVHFRTWALNHDLPRERWEAVFKEFLED